MSTGDRRYLLGAIAAEQVAFEVGAPDVPLVLDYRVYVPLVMR
ncbi:MAG: hypothetical protein ACYC4L_03940 [Chloroflexota bacterium]